MIIFVGFTSCEYDGIDPLTPVDPGQDAGSPVVSVEYPQEGTTIKVVEEISSINIRFEVTDDIEIADIEVAVDGNMIASMSEFTDYRIVSEQVMFNNLTNGDHVLTVTATDMAGNTTTSTVNFSKEPPYTPKFEGEYLYMPFDGDYIDLVTITNPTVEGSPAFDSDAFFGTGAYTGTANSYLSFPIDTDELGTEFSAAFWYKVNDDPNRAGILVAGADENRTQGFRLFREAAGDQQRIKANIGNGTGESWNDGGLIDVDGDWVHVAFTVSNTQSAIYINGTQVNTSTVAGGIDWTNVEELTIGNGGPTFSYWNHLYDSSSLDELRLFDRALTADEVQALINASAETFQMSFEGEYSDAIANREISVVGDPGFSTDAAQGSQSYEGAEGSYLTASAEGLKTASFSGTFWYKVSAEAGRAGIITIAPEDTENPDAQNNRSSGFRLFREASGEMQRIKLHVGNANGDNWNDGGLVDPASSDWVHVAFTIQGNESAVYIDGELVNTGAISGDGISWEAANTLSIMSGAPHFTGWNHLSDTSLIDDLTFYNKALTQDEIQADMNQ